MSVTGTTLRATAVGDGTTVNFVYDFEILSVTELGVYITDTSDVLTKKAYGTDYTVSGVLAPAGGTVTFLTAPSTGFIVTMIRESSEVQPDTFGTGQAVPSQDYEQGLDRLTLIAQELNDKISRMPQPSVDVNLSGISMAFPLSTVDGNIQYIAWNAAGTALIVVENISTGTVTIDSSWNAVLTSAFTPSNMRTLIGSANINGSDIFATTAGTSTAYTLTVNSAINTLTTGLVVVFKAHVANAGASTLAVNGLTAKNLTKYGTNALAVNDILLNQVVIAIYDGTQFQCFPVGTVAYATASGTSGTATLAGNVSGTIAINHGGTGQVTQQLSMNALAGAVTSARFLRGDGSNVSMAAIQASDVPTLNQNTSGSSGSCTGNSLTATTATNATNLLVGSTPHPGADFALGAVPTQLGSTFTKIYNSRATDTGGTGVTFTTGLSTCVTAQATAENGAGPALAYITSNTTTTPGSITATAGVAGAIIHLTAYGT
jgi:hypothetical protein